MAAPKYYDRSLYFIFLMLRVYLFYTVEGSLTILDVRLANGTMPNEGTVWYLQSDSQNWTRTCASGLGINDVIVICRHLGFAGANRALKNSPFGGPFDNQLHKTIKCDEGEENITTCTLEPGCDSTGGAVCYGSNYLGCYEDMTGNGRVLNDQKNLSIGGLTIDKCLKFCRSFPDMVFAGLEFGNECYCGDSSSNYSKHGQVSSDSDCHFPCDGSKYQSCGGSGFIAIFNLTAGPHLPSNSTVTESTIHTTTSQQNSKISNWLCRFQNTTCGTLFEHGQWDLAQEEGQMNVYLEANFTSHSSKEGDTATFIIEHEFNSYAGELQFFFFSATDSSPNITETSPNSTDRKSGSFSITTCRNDNRPLFYIEHYNWEWVFIERLPYSCDNKDDVEIKLTAINGGSRTVIRVDAILIFEMPSLPETVTEDSLPRSPDAVTAESPDYLRRESHEKQDPAQVTMMLSIALAVTATLFLCTLIIIAILLCDHKKLIRPDASIKLDAHSEFKSSGQEHDESLVKGICTIQTSSRDVQDGASTDTSEVIWNMMQMESAEEEFEELKDAFPPMQGRGFVDAVVKTQLKDPKLYLESKAKLKMTHQSGGYPRIDQRPSKNSTGKVIARPEEAFEVDVNSFEGKVNFVSNPVYDRIPNGHTQTGDGHVSPMPNRQTNSRMDDVWFGLGITFYRNQDTDDTALTRNPLGHHLDYITEDRDYAAHIIGNHGNSRKGGFVPVGMARSRATALARYTIDGVDATASNC